MANILAGKRIVPELLQGDANVKNLLAIGRRWMEEPELLEPVREELRAVRRNLGEGGASRRAAEAVLETAEGRA